MTCNTLMPSHGDGALLAAWWCLPAKFATPPLLVTRQQPATPTTTCSTLPSFQRSEHAGDARHFSDATFTRMAPCPATLQRNTVQPQRCSKCRTGDAPSQHHASPAARRCSMAAIGPGGAPSQQGSCFIAATVVRRCSIGTPAAPHRCSIAGVHTLSCQSDAPPMTSRSMHAAL